MPGVSAPNNTEPKGPKHLNMIEMAAPSIIIISPLDNLLVAIVLSISRYSLMKEVKE